MMQITGKSVPRRGLTLLLALVLGAGLALTGCGDDDSSTTTPAPAPAPTPAPAPPAPDPVAVPSGLKVAATGVDFIEFMWEAVEGASGYEIQMSMAEGDFSSVSTAMVETTMHRFTVAAETTAYARVRAHEGDRQSDWSETATGTSSVAPLVLAAPTVTVSSTGQDHIEWSWNAVENAAGYVFQVAATMAGLETAEVQFTMETMHRAEADPDMEMYIRVRATGGDRENPTVSDWSAAVMGMSDVAPMPLMVSMRPPDADADRACGGQVFCPDNQSDATKAMAHANRNMIVNSSVSARVTPMFVNDASGVVVDAGDDQTPFTDRTWNAMQTMVAGDGASFKFERVSTGAGQEPMPTGDVMYITCGPFRCSEAADEMPSAPEITLADSAVCENFEVNLRLVKGGALNGDYRTYSSGVDVGWVYTSSHAARVTHEFANVAAGASMVVPGTSLVATSTERSLDMLSTSATSSRNKFGGAANRNEESYTLSPDHPTRTRSNPSPILNGLNDCMSIDATGHDNNRSRGAWSYYSMVRSVGGDRREVRPVRRPQQCVRLVTDGLYELPGHNTKVSVTHYNYLPGYSVHVDPVGGVSWAGSSVSDWGDDHPFDELKCPRVTFEAQEQLDVCADFEEEVDAYWGAGIGRGGAFRVEFEMGAGDTNATGRLNEIVIRNSSRKSNGQVPRNTDGSVDAERAGGWEYRAVGSRHANMWLVDKSDGVSGSNTGIDGTKRDPNLYWTNTNDNAIESRNGTHLWRPVMTLKMTDVDGDPAHGDFGKIDMVAPNGQADNMTGTGPTGQADHVSCTNSDGPGCDATMTFDLSATFTRIQDTDSCTRTIEQSITCTWDADGNRKRKGPTVFDTGRTDNTFISCEAAN